MTRNRVTKQTSVRSPPAESSPMSPPRSQSSTAAQKGRRLINTLKCVAAPGCSSQRKNSMLPEEDEEGFGRVETISTTLTDDPTKAPCDRQSPGNQFMSQVNGTNTMGSVEELDGDGFPILTSSMSKEVDHTFDSVLSGEPQGAENESLYVMRRGDDTDNFVNLKKGNEETQQQPIDMYLSSFASDPFDDSWHRRIAETRITSVPEQEDTPQPIPPDGPEDWRELLRGAHAKPVVIQGQNKAPSELDLVLAAELSTSQDSTMTMTTSSTTGSKSTMDEIMEQAKNRRAKLEQAQNQLAREPSGETTDFRKEDVTHLMKRIDKLSKYLNDEENSEAWENPVSVETGLSSLDSSTDKHYHNVVDASHVNDVERPTLSSPDRSLPPRIQPSVSCQATTLRPLFWKSHPNYTTKSPPASMLQTNIGRPQQSEGTVIENLPRINSISIPTTTTSSLVVLSPRQHSQGQSIVRMPTVSPPTSTCFSKTEQLQNQSLNLSLAQQRIATRAAAAARSNDGHAEHVIVKSNKIVRFPSVPTKATSYEGQGLHGTSYDDSNEWTADCKWDSGQSGSSRGDGLGMGEI